jgi:predicted RecB family nuclease
LIAKHSFGEVDFSGPAEPELKSPDAALDHFEFLAEDERDPRGDFAASLCDVLGRRGHIVVYNAGFESQRLTELARWLPDYKRRMAKIQDRLWDLWPIIRSNIYHPGFQGSFSLKAVAPALVPELTYEDMEIAHGEAAGLAWEEVIRTAFDSEERKRLRNALLAYCRQDTLALAKMVVRLRSA